MPQLISCLMPTHNRRRFVPGAIRCFLEQTWEARELVIFDDGDDPVHDLVPDDPRIRYIASPERLPLWKKRRFLSDDARGEIMAIWDDDDWHGPDRLTRQAEPIIARRADATLLDHIICHDHGTGMHKRWNWRSIDKRAFVDGTLVFSEDYYNEGPPYHESFHETRTMVLERPTGMIEWVDGEDLYRQNIHGENYATRIAIGPGWEPKKV